MDKQGLLNKISFILQDLKGQHLKLTGNAERIPEIELELFMANARYLVQHLEVLQKVNGNTFDVKARDEILKNILKEHNETTQALNIPVSTLPNPEVTKEASLAHAILNDFPFPKLDGNSQVKPGVVFENKQGVFAPELERRAAMVAAQNAAEKEVRERELAFRLANSNRESELIKTLNDTYKSEVQSLNVKSEPASNLNTNEDLTDLANEKLRTNMIIDSDLFIQQNNLPDLIPSETVYQNHVPDQAQSDDFKKENSDPCNYSGQIMPDSNQQPQNLIDKLREGTSGSINPQGRNSVTNRNSSFQGRTNFNSAQVQAKIIDLNGGIQGHGVRPSDFDSFKGNTKPAVKQFDLNQADLNNALPVKNINDLLAGQKTGPNLINRLDSLPVKDIRKAVGLNEHLLFIKTLFNGDPKAYDRSLTIIDSLKNSQQAQDFITQISDEYSWSSKAAVAELFKNIVNRKFSRH